jgi:anti-sigma factor RsiW
MNNRDIELLSAYLDGELKPSDSTRLETRLKTDLELASVLNDLRAARTLLRKLPSRKAPRNFTLTRKMVGQNPPLPRTYPFFRLATTVATLLFFFTFGLNFVGSQLASQAPAFGMGGGGGAEEMQSYAAEEAPAEEPAAAAPMAPAPAEAMPTATAEEPSVSLAPQATELPLTEEARIGETSVAKEGETENTVGQDQTLPQEDALQTTEVQSPPRLVSSAWQIGLAAVVALGLLLMGLMRQLSARRWK